MQRRPDREQSLRETQRGWILCRDLDLPDGARAVRGGWVDPADDVPAMRHAPDKATGAGFAGRSEQVMRDTN